MHQSLPDLLCSIGLLQTENVTTSYSVSVASLSSSTQYCCYWSSTTAWPSLAFSDQTAEKSSVSTTAVSVSSSSCSLVGASFSSSVLCLHTVLQISRFVTHSVFTEIFASLVAQVQQIENSLEELIDIETGGIEVKDELDVCIISIH